MTWNHYGHHSKSPGFLLALVAVPRLDFVLSVYLMREGDLDQMLASHIIVDAIYTGNILSAGLANSSTVLPISFAYQGSSAFYLALRFRARSIRGDSAK